MPVIFRVVDPRVPVTRCPRWAPGGWLDRMGRTSRRVYPLYTFLEIVLISFFAYFYTASSSTDDVA